MNFYNVGLVAMGAVAGAYLMYNYLYRKIARFALSNDCKKSRVVRRYVTYQKHED